MEKLNRYLKRFVAWATGLWERYRSDPFFRTQVHIVGLALLFAVVCVGTAALLLTEPQAAVLFLVVGGIIAGVVGVLLTRTALTPTRDSLHYQKIFISNVAHELRTPLSTIKTSTEVALIDDSLPATLRSMLVDIVGELDRVSEILNNLLSLNTFERPERMLFQNVDMGPVIEEVAKRHATFARERGVEMVIKMDDYRVVWGNTGALEQVTTNLIKNALSYTPKNTHGTVTISLNPDYHGHVVMSVTDSGIGISQEDLFHIFEPFYRADTSRVRNVKKSGSGLGLTIVNEIVRAHQGRISIESERRKGTTVSVFLPCGHTQKKAPTEEKRAQFSLDFSRGFKDIILHK